MTDETAAPDPDLLDRRALLRTLARAINETAERVSGERFRPREGDRERLAYLRTLVSLVTAYNGVFSSTRDYRLDGVPEVPPPLTARQLERKRREDEMGEELADMLVGIYR